jgi:uncharacterized protein YqeY
MGLRERLEADQRDAMRSGQTARLNTIRMLRSAIQRAEQARRKALMDALLESRTAGAEAEAEELSEPEIADITRRATLSDQELVDTVVANEVKQRRDSIAQFRKAGRQDLVDKEEGELHVLLAYLPDQLSEVEIEALVRATIAEVGAQGPRDMGKVMGRLAPQLRGKADMSAVGPLVQRLLAG